MQKKMYNTDKFINGLNNICTRQNDSDSDSDSDSNNAIEMVIRDIDKHAQNISYNMLCEYYRDRLDAIVDIPYSMRCSYAMSGKVNGLLGVIAMPYMFAIVHVIDEALHRLLRMFFLKREEFESMYINTEWWKKSEAIIQYIISHGIEGTTLDILINKGKQPAIEKIPVNDECLISYEQITNLYVECTGPIPHCYDIDEYSKYATIDEGAYICPYDKTYEMNVQCFVVPK